MNPSTFIRWGLMTTTAAAVLTLTACSSYDLQQGLAQLKADTGDFAQGDWTLARTAEERARQAELSQQLLAQPLGQAQAVQLMLANSPALQALLAQGWMDSALAAQSGRIANPVLAFERVVTGSETELNRFLSFGLLDLLTLPLRQGVAEQRLQQSRLRLASELVDRVTQVRQAWVRAVTAEQLLGYARQVYESAESSAELARRMEAVGNFNKLTRARHQAFYADAGAQLVTAQQQALAQREALVRLLGLSAAQAAQLQLPARLPALPAEPLSPEAAGQLATRDRLDVQAARAAFDAAARAQGLVGLTSLTDIELTVQRGRLQDGGASTAIRGQEVGVRLPLFDGGGLQRDAMNAQTLAAANQLEATLRAAASNLRESYAAYRAAHELGRHYLDEVVPLRKAIADENLLRYNGMLIGVFELLADARDQVGTVMAAIAAEQQFWLADAALRASLIGRPMTTALAGLPAMAVREAGGH